MTSTQALSKAESSPKSFTFGNAGEPGLYVRGLTFAYERAAGGRTALDGVSFGVASGSTLAVVGPSGAGKSTLLRVVAGLLAARSGEIVLDGVPLHARPARLRRIALVFQDDALFPTMSVRENLRFALRPGARAARVEEIAVALHVDVHLERKPRELSGGERQRVSLARALLSDPLALLLDEPLAHLDPALRGRVRDATRDLRGRFGGPVVYVTHDHGEAMMIADVLAVLVDGRLEDYGPPQRVYDAPATLRAASALGVPPMNFLQDGPCIVGIRPERVLLVADGSLCGSVERWESVGADAYVHVRTHRGLVSARVPAERAYARGDAVALHFPPDHVRRFDATSGAAIP